MLNSPWSTPVIKSYVTTAISHGSGNITPFKKTVGIMAVEKLSLNNLYQMSDVTTYKYKSNYQDGNQYLVYNSGENLYLSRINISNDIEGTVLLDKYGRNPVMDLKSLPSPIKNGTYEQPLPPIDSPAIITITIRDHGYLIGTRIIVTFLSGQRGGEENTYTITHVLDEDRFRIVSATNTNIADFGDIATRNEDDVDYLYVTYTLNRWGFTESVLIKTVWFRVETKSDNTVSFIQEQPGLEYELPDPYPEKIVPRMKVTDDGFIYEIGRAHV
jgi:hypothetical protein